MWTDDLPLLVAIAVGLLVVVFAQSPWLRSLVTAGLVAFGFWFGTRRHDGPKPTTQPKPSRTTPHGHNLQKLDETVDAVGRGNDPDMADDIDWADKHRSL